MKSTYTAYAALKDGTPRRRDFQSSKNAIAYARRIANEGGACFVVRDGKEVVFNTRSAIEDVLLTSENFLLPKTINSV